MFSISAWPSLGMMRREWPDFVPVAQLDRASASGAEGYRFDPCRERSVSEYRSISDAPHGQILQRSFEQVLDRADGLMGVTAGTNSFLRSNGEIQFSLLGCPSSAFSILHSIALPLGFQDVVQVSAAIPRSTSEPFAAQDSGPVLECEEGGDDNAVAFVGRRVHIEEESRPGLTCRDIAQHIKDRETELAEEGSQPAVSFSAQKGAG